MQRGNATTLGSASSTWTSGPLRLPYALLQRPTQVNITPRRKHNRGGRSAQPALVDSGVEAAGREQATRVDVGGVVVVQVVVQVVVSPSLERWVFSWAESSAAPALERKSDGRKARRDD